MRADVRDAVRQRFGSRCGYCGVHDEDAAARLTVDHYRPRSRGGTDDLANLVYCCHACNEHKSDTWSDDPEHRALHPLDDDLSRHLSTADDFTLRGLTEAGRFHIVLLHLNRPELVAYRRKRAEGERDTAEVAVIQAEIERMSSELLRLAERLRRFTPRNRGPGR
jgi:hypothetical protein